jgi:hypothetical protein
MDPFLEKSPLFHELHTQMLSEAQKQLQPQVRPKYIAKLERHLSEGSVWGMEAGVLSLDRKEPDLTLLAAVESAPASESSGALPAPTATATRELDEDELELRKQRRIVIYVNAVPRLAVTTIELLSPSNKESGCVGQARYLEKRASALHGGLQWVEIDLLRGGQRPPLNVDLPKKFDCLAYVAQAIPTGWHYFAYGWGLREPLPPLLIPLLGADQALLDLAACFRVAYDAIGADEEAGYASDPPLPRLRARDRRWTDALLREKGLRT